MTWAGTTRTSTPQHRARRLRVLARDSGRCHVCGLKGATELDHIIPIAEGGADTDNNCAPIHTRCHRTKSSSEGGRARARKQGSAQRTPEPHPGLTPPHAHD